jgi:hypothetical protein
MQSSQAFPDIAARAGPNVPKDFVVREVLENIETGPGGMVAFELQGSGEPIVYQRGKESVGESTECP